MYTGSVLIKLNLSFIHYRSNFVSLSLLMNHLTFFAAGPENKCQGIFVSKRNNLLSLFAYSEILSCPFGYIMSFGGSTVLNNISKCLLFELKVFSYGNIHLANHHNYNNLMERLVKRGHCCVICYS